MNHFHFLFDSFDITLSYFLAIHVEQQVQSSDVSDCSLCVWSVREGRLLQRLTSHQDEVYVLEPHPTLPDILMSGAHDGNVIIWNVTASNVIFKHCNV